MSKQSVFRKQLYERVVRSSPRDQFVRSSSTSESLEVSF
jgi:hypothetical protein